MAPTKLGKYDIDAELGRGAMGIVYRATDSRLGRPVALKTISPTLASDPTLLKRFYREAQSAGQLRHPNIVTIYDIDEADGIPFIAMEFLEGQALDRIVTERKDLPVVRKLDIVIQTCRGLHYAHQHGIVHRDVKPGNILVLSDGLVKIVDFGIARIGTTTMTRTGMILGTPTYMSPEQISGHTVDARADIFSVGVILYELISFQNPFAASDVPTILYKIMNVTPPPITDLVPNCPPELQRIIERATAKDREDRYQSAEDLAFDLQHVADSLKRSMLEIYIRQSQDGIQQGNLTLAKESLQKALEIDSQHDMARSLLNDVQDQIYKRQRAQKIEELMRDAQECLKAEHYDEALSLLGEVFRLEPAHSAATATKQRVLEQRERNQKIARHMSQAEKFMAQADYQAAQGEIEAVLSLDPANTSATKLMEEAGRKLVEQERLKEVRKNTEAARTCIGEKNFDQAIKLLSQANEIDPLNIEVETLMRLARSGQEQEERRRLLDERLAVIQEALNREEYVQAIGLAERALQEFPGDARTLKLHTQATRLAEIQKKRRFVDEQLQAAREFLQKNLYKEAAAVLEHALESVPDDVRLASFLKTVQETRTSATLEAARRDAVREANDLIRKKDFPAAILALENALASTGQSPELNVLLQYAREQQEELRRQEHVQDLLTRAQARLREEDFDQALDILEKGRREFAADELEALFNTARERKTKFEQGRKEAIDKASRMLKEGAPARAVASLDAAPRAYFKDEKFQQIYAQAREAQDRALAIRQIIERVDKFVDSENWAEGERVLQEGLRAYADDKGLLASRDRLQEVRLRSRRRQLAKLLEEAKVNIGKMLFKEALDLLNSVNWEAEQIPDLANQARSLIEDARKRQESRLRARQEQLGKLLEEAKTNIVKAQFKEAIDLLNSVNWEAEQAPDLAQQARALLQDARQHEREMATRGTLAGVAPLQPTTPSDVARLREAQEKLRKALQETTPGQATVIAPVPILRPPTGVEPGARPRPKPAPLREAKPEAAPSPAAAAPSVARAPAVPVAVTPQVVRRPMALWIGLGALTVLVLGVALWRFTAKTTTGYAQVTAVPWAHVVDVKNQEGQSLKIEGDTPLEISLAPGNYVIELRNGQAVGQVEVVVKAHEVTRVNYAFPQVDVNGLVDELVSKY